MADQLSLPVNLRAEARLDNYYVASGTIRSQVLDSLQREFCSGREAGSIYLWGAQGAGITHLLYAACHFTQNGEDSDFGAQFLPLGEFADCDPGPLLEGMERYRLVCLHHLHRVIGNANWELALFDLYHRLQDGGRSMLISANGPPASLPFSLPDLQSRFAASNIYHLPAYSDTEKLAILQYRASSLGLQLADDAAGYLAKRAPRNLKSLMALLHKLDRAALEQQRRLSIPFIKATLGW